MSVFNGIRINEITPFALHSGGESHVLFDVQAMLRDPSDRNYILGLLNRSIASFGDFKVLVGIELGGALLAAMLADRHRFDRDHQFGVVRKDGTCSLPVSMVDTRVILIDDVITTGASVNAARVVLRQLGYDVIGVVCVIDRSGATAPY